jgi:hypothetical protein
VSTTRNTDTVEVIMRDQLLHSWSLAENVVLVCQSYALRVSVSVAACRKALPQAFYLRAQASASGALTAVCAREIEAPNAQRPACLHARRNCQAAARIR